MLFALDIRLELIRMLNKGAALGDVVFSSLQKRVSFGDIPFEGLAALGEQLGAKTAAEIR